MTREEIVQIMERRNEGIARRDIAGLLQLYAKDGVVESLMAGTVTGRPAIAEVFEAWFKAFPDVTFAMDDPLVDGHRAVQTAVVMGTDIGGFMGLPPTGKPFRLPMVIIYTLQDGFITHERRIYDFTGLLVQIGVLKAKPA